jgi:ATP-dependent RNA helicase DeaD
MMLKKHPQIIVATPAGLWSLKAWNNPSRPRADAVLDEADRMLEWVFTRGLGISTGCRGERIWRFCRPPLREVMTIGWMYQRDPVEVTFRKPATSRTSANTA